MAEAIFSAVIGDVTSRAISLLVGNLKVDQNTEGKLQRICNMLIKINSVVEEAKGKQITNHGTLEWLSELIDGTYQGRYLLDTIGCGEPELEDQNGDEVFSKPFSLSMFNPAKRMRVAAFTMKNILFRHSIGVDEIDKAVESLQSICGDLKEFIMLLQGCQPIHGPLATNIFIEGQMFGRHVEKEMIINFLLHEDHLSTRKLGVLPILGDIVVGKTTLVQHTCDDPRVRCQFTTILLFTFSHTYKMDVQEPTSVLRPKHIIGDAGNSDHPLNDLKKNFFNKRFLIVFEDVDMHKMHMLEELLLNLDCGKQGSKIIVTTNNKHVARIGTVQPIKLKFLLRPEYWFFFKAYAFPGTDVQENPRLVAAGKSIAVKLNGSFFGAKIIGGMLRANPNPKLWGIDEDITLSDTHNTPLLDVQGPITRARARQLNLEVNSFLCSYLYDLENRLLPNDCIMIRNHGEYMESFGGMLGGMEDRQGRPSPVGGPNQFDFGHGSDSRTSLH